MQNFQPPTQANANAINQEGKVLISTITARVEDGVTGRRKDKILTECNVHCKTHNMQVSNKT